MAATGYIPTLLEAPNGQQDSTRAALLKALLAQDTSPVRSPWQAAARAVQSGISGLMLGMSDKASRAQLDGLKGAFENSPTPASPMTDPTAITGTPAPAAAASSSGNPGASNDAPDTIPMPGSTLGSMAISGLSGTRQVWTHRRRRCVHDEPGGRGRQDAY